MNFTINFSVPNSLELSAKRCLSALLLSLGAMFNLACQPQSVVDSNSLHASSSCEVREYYEQDLVLRGENEKGEIFGLPVVLIGLTSISVSNDSKSRGG